MADFIPEQPKAAAAVPYYEDVTSEGGWQGHSTRKSLETLKLEVMAVISRLGGSVASFQRGRFAVDGKSREGFRINYVVQEPGGNHMMPGRIDIAALPVKEWGGGIRSIEAHREASLRMALYMLRMALDGTWFLQQLSPGYSALMPWMLTDRDKTITQLWSESAIMKNLLPPGKADFIEGEFKEA